MIDRRSRTMYRAALEAVPTEQGRGSCASRPVWPRRDVSGSTIRPMNGVLCVALIAAAGAVGMAAKDPQAAEPAREVGSHAMSDWPWWRGPTRDGVAPAGQEPPLRWSDTENVIWSHPIPGRGHGSPTVVGDQVFVAVADAERNVQSVISFDRASGLHQWETVVHQGEL
ncbi:MAG: PQQ-binding-like beta-propeller repeat protein, partial [Pirellulaceae bacterium]